MPVVVFCDVDDTLINAKGDINLSLVDVLRNSPINQLWLLTSYCLHWNALSNTTKNALRIDVIRRLKRYGLDVDFIVTSATPYHPLEESKYYYHNVLEPIERRCREEWLKNQQREKIEQILAQYLNVSQTELNLIKERIVTESQEYKGGKQHIMEYSLNFVPKNFGVVFFDDKLEVNKTTELVANGDICKARNIHLLSHPVHFKYLDEGSLVYEESLAKVGDLEEGSLQLRLKARKVIVTILFIEESLLFINGRLNQALVPVCRQCIGIVLITNKLHFNEEAFSQMLTDNQITLCCTKIFNFEQENLLGYLDLFAETAGKYEQKYNFDPLHFVVVSQREQYINLINRDYQNDPAVDAIYFSGQTDDFLLEHFKSLYKQELRLLGYLVIYSPELKNAIEIYDASVTEQTILLDKFSWEFGCRVLEELRSNLLDPQAFVDTIETNLAKKKPKNDKLWVKKVRELGRNLFNANPIR